MYIFILSVSDAYRYFDRLRVPTWTQRWGSTTKTHHSAFVLSHRRTSTTRRRYCVFFSCGTGKACLNAPRTPWKFGDFDLKFTYLFEANLRIFIRWSDVTGLCPRVCRMSRFGPFYRVFYRYCFRITYSIAWGRTLFHRWYTIEVPEIQWRLAGWECKMIHPSRF